MLRIKSFIKSEMGDAEDLFIFALCVLGLSFLLIMATSGSSDSVSNKDTSTTLQKVYDQQYIDLRKYNSFASTYEFAERNPLFKTQGNARLYIWASDDEFCAIAYDNTDKAEPKDTDTLVARALNLKAVDLSSVDQKQKYKNYRSSEDSTKGGCATKIPAFEKDAPYFDSTGLRSNG